MIKTFFKKLTASTPDPSRMRRRQYILMGSILAAGLALLHFITHRPLETLHEVQTEDKKQKARLETPFEAVNPRDVWVNRVQKEAEDARAEAKSVREENQLLGKKIDVIEKLFQGGGISVPEKGQAPRGFVPPLGSETSANLPDDKGHQNQKPVLPSASALPSEISPDLSDKNEDLLFDGKPASKIFHRSVSDSAGTLLKNVDNYVPAGSYARAILTSGVVASTALQSSSQPQPIVLRLVEGGHLPRGFKGSLKDNVLIGACYGDLSSERVMCRLETMSWVEEDGITVEKKVEGWVIGEDGRPGLRGEVVDRSGEAVRDTLMAGMLSGLSGFLKSEAMSSVYPVSPFGQTNALKGKRALEGAASSGVGNALDKLAEFSIKRVEQMQPVILIASGRVVDIVFKSGVDIRPELTAPSLTLMDQKQSSPKEQKNDDNY